MKVTILGNNSALPAHGRYPTAQIVEINEMPLLIDCGEGTQMRMQQFGIKSSRINHIFISHIHGDHYLGLVGFISSLSLLGRQRTLYVYCPAEIKDYVMMQLPWSLGFYIEFRIIAEDECGVLVDTAKFSVSCFPVTHSVPTHGFLVIEKKRKRVLDLARLREFEIPKYYYSKLTEGEDYTKTMGEVIKNEWVTLPGPKPKKYAYCADTLYTEDILPHIQGVDLLYHESTYLSANKEKALLRMHSTAEQAAQIASLAKVGKLLIGHFSSKYKELEPFLEEAEIVFKPTYLAIEGHTFEV
jgi:ribonuclease Z